MENEKREAVKRWEVNWKARLRINFRNSIKNFHGVVKNLNFKGMQVQLSKELPALEVLKVTVVLPSEDSFTVKARVAWKKDLPEGLRLYGLHFVGVKDFYREAILQVLRKNCLPEMLKSWWEDAD